MIKKNSLLKQNKTLKKEDNRRLTINNIDNNDEIKKSLEEEFENPLPDIEPTNSCLNFLDIRNNLSRDKEWEIRKEKIQNLVSFCRGTTDVKKFIREFKGILDPFLDCLLDNRSSLCKFTCLALVSISKVLGEILDQCSEVLIPPLLSRTSNGTLIISESSQFAVIRFTENVQGKRIKQILTDSISSNSITTRITCILSIISAEKVWKKDLWISFQDILGSKKKDPSDKVRNLINNYFGEMTPLKKNENILPSSIKSTKSFIPSITPLKKKK